MPPRPPAEAGSTVEGRAASGRVPAVDYAVGTAVCDRADTIPGLTRATACGPGGPAPGWGRGEPGQDQLRGDDQHREYVGAPVRCAGSRGAGRRRSVTASCKRAG